MKKNKKQSEVKCGSVNITKRVSAFLLGAALALFYGPSVALAAPILLGSAQSFAVLGASTVTNTGSSVVNGNLGVWPGSAVTGFPPGLVNAPGVIHAGDAVAQQAQTDVTNAYIALGGLSPTSNLSGQVLGSAGLLTLFGGVYHFDKEAQLTGPLTLDAQGNPNALFVFQIGSTLTTASASSVQVINGGANNGVYWQVGSSATLGTSTVFAGNILALESITLTTSAEILCGRALARNGAVTMDSNNFISGNCASGGNFGSGRTDFGSAGFSGGGVQAIPEPGSVTLLSTGLLLILLGWRSRKQSR